MRTTLIAFAELKPQPWKNGGGVTRELAAEPEGADFLWRLSMAEVEASGPFSAFPGIDRTLTLLTGEGLKLDFAEGIDEVIDTPLRPFSFDGGRPCIGRLIGGPVRDLNVMTKRGKASHRVRAISLSRGDWSETLANEVTAVLSLGQVSVEAMGQRYELKPFDTFLMRRDSLAELTKVITISGKGQAMLVEIDLSP